MSAARDVRIIALWRDDPKEAPMTIDARIDGARIVSAWDLFGAFALDGDSVRPFILRRDGRIDFGHGESWRSDLRDATIMVGSEFSVWFNESDSGRYRIVKLAVLGAKDNK
ncbi:hypothetical protein [Methylocystis hirsuta]|uniref:Uncharacterized protein n=1 Tax=Methylocystis hirsuta TaxID=369798 RepID=A0A3M9XQA7_9HYPH|nr:hypothetical protein [Methylocystis hirsuta]RNJ50469.1 hypothetical protein D1O30_13640 [Methylocystis hirsuta]